MSKDIMVNGVEEKKNPKKWILISAFLVLIIIFTVVVLQKKQPIKQQSSNPPQNFNTQLANEKQKYEATKNIPQPTPTEQLQSIETQLKSQKNPSSSAKNLNLYIEAAGLAYQLKLPTAKQYALTALSLMPKDSRVRQALSGSISSMQIISKGN